MTVSVVIPALNVAGLVGSAIESVRRQEGSFEVIVVDGGSTDATVAEAEQALEGMAGRVIAAPRGRARQMNAGAARASGDVLLFLHADTVLPEGAFEAVRGALADRRVAGGCFRLRFDVSSPLMRFYQLGVWMRWHSLAFGDRAQFVRRTVFESAGGFPDQPLFEDLDLVRRIRQHGRFVFLRQSVTTSARRFESAGRLRQQARNLALWLLYRTGVRPDRLKRFYPD